MIIKIHIYSTSGFGSVSVSKGRGSKSKSLLHGCQNTDADYMEYATSWLYLDLWTLYISVFSFRSTGRATACCVCSRLLSYRSHRIQLLNVVVVVVVVEGILAVDQ